MGRAHRIDATGHRRPASGIATGPNRLPLPGASLRSPSDDSPIFAATCQLAVDDRPWCVVVWHPFGDADLSKDTRDAEQARLASAALLKLEHRRTSTRRWKKHGSRTWLPQTFPEPEEEGEKALKSGVLGALPERWVTHHSGDIGDTFGPLRGEQRCPGRSVTSWTSG
jgi:hypothetical protein